MTDLVDGGGVEGSGVFCGIPGVIFGCGEALFKSKGLQRMPIMQCVLSVGSRLKDVSRLAVTLTASRLIVKRLTALCAMGCYRNLCKLLGFNHDVLCIV